MSPQFPWTGSDVTTTAGGDRCGPAARALSHAASMWRGGAARSLRLAAVGVAAVALTCCSGGGSSSSNRTTTVATTARTLVTTTVPAAGASTSAAPTSVAPGQTAPTATTPGAATTAAGRTVSSPSANVHLGDSGSGVKQIQTALVAHGYKVAVDGQFGAQTSQAVKDFQKKNGLSQDGVVGPVTWAKLQAASSTTTTTKSSSSTTTKSGTTTTTAKKTTTTT